jgi:hypothetical protein
MNSSEDSNISLLEQELASLRPLPPNPEFMLRLSKRMARATGPAPLLEENTAQVTPFGAKTPAKGRSWQKLAPWAVAASVSVAATGGYIINQRGKGDPVAQQRAERSAALNQVLTAQREVQAVKKEEITILPNQDATRTIRLQYNNHYQVQDGNGQQFHYHYPTEETIVIPMRFR